MVPIHHNPELWYWDFLNKIQCAAATLHNLDNQAFIVKRYKLWKNLFALIESLSQDKYQEFKKLVPESLAVIQHQVQKSCDLGIW